MRGAARARRGAGARKEQEFPEEDAPNPGVRETTLAGVGYAPADFMLHKFGTGLDRGRDLVGSMLPERMAHELYTRVLVLNVPRDLLYSDATQWGAFDTSVPLNAMHARSMAFILAAVHRAAVLLPGTIRVFAELMVRETLGLGPDPDPMYDTDAVFDRSNVVGYRLWIVFGAGAPEPEVVLRRCIFSVQGYMGLVSPAVAEIKERVMATFDLAEREKVVQEMCSAQKRRGKDADGPAKRRAGPESDSEPRGDVSSDSEAPAKARRRAKDGDEPPAPPPLTPDVVVALARTQPPSAIVARLAARRFRHLGNLWHGVGTLDAYLRDVVCSAHVLAGSATTSDYATRWGVAPALAMPDAEGVSLPAASTNGSAAAELCWSFERSVATFYDDAPEHSACVEQLTAGAYGLNADQLYFPFPNLVWELAVSTLNPIDFFGERMPWTKARFEPAARSLVARLGEQEIDRMELCEAAAVPMATSVTEPPALRMQNVIADMARARVPAGDRSDVARVAASIRLAESEHASAATARRAAYRADVANQFARIELERAYALTPYVTSAETGCIETEKLMAAVIPVYTEACELMDRALQALEKLAPPPTAHPETWRYMERLRLHRAYRSDIQAALFGTIARGSNVPEVYRRALARIRETNRLSASYVADWCRLPQMSVPANAMVALGSRLVSGINMMHGVLETINYLAVTAVQAADPELRDANHTLIYGQAGSSKSYNFERAHEALLGGTIVDRDWMSAASAYSHSNDSNKISYRDEAGDILTNQTQDAMRRNGEALARYKMQLTKGICSFDRYHKSDEDERSKTLRVEARRPMVETALANFIKFGVGVDPALLDRFNVVAFMPFAMSNVMAVERAHDPLAGERRELWAHFCEMYKTEIAFKTLLVVLARANVIASVNTDVLKTMLTEALVDATEYMPSLGESMRAAGRNEQYAVSLIFHTAFYTVMRSEASELARWAHVGAEQTLQPAFLDDIATIFGPHLYARADHGCWMLTQTVRMSYPFQYYIVMLLIAAFLGRFRRSFMAISYRRHGARFIDDAVAERLESRELAGRVLPEFVNELLRIECNLENTVVQNHGHTAAPAFYEHNNMCDPNWIVIDGKIEAIAHRITPYVQRIYKVDESQVVTMIGHIASKLRLNVPIYAEVSARKDFTASALNFARDASDKQTGRIVYAPRQFIRVSKGGEPSMMISTGALMIPPQMLLVLMLTAAENKYTEPVQTVLPIEVHGNAQLMHTWRVCARPDNDPVFTNRTALTHSAIRMERRSTTAMPAVMGNIVRTAGTDIVRAAFYRHMRELYQMPPFETVLAQLRAAAPEQFVDVPDVDPTPEQFERVFRAWADASPAAPGADVARRAWAYRASRELSAEASNRHNIIHYPQTNMLDQAAQTFLMTQLRGGPLPTIPRRNNNRRAVASSFAAMCIDDLPAGAAAKNTYPENRVYVRKLMLELCAGRWFEQFRLYSASVEWRHLFMMLVDAVWGPDSAAARRLAADGTMPTEPCVLSERHATQLSQEPRNLEFDPAYLSLLAEWLHFVYVTRRIAIAFVRDPSIRSVQHAYDSLVEVAVAPEDLRIARLIDSVRAAGPDIDIPEAVEREYARYVAAMDRLRPLRAARLDGLLTAAKNAAAANQVVSRLGRETQRQDAENRKIADLPNNRLH